MTWSLRDEDMRKFITNSAQPPAAAVDLFTDDGWSGVFSMWATDMAYGGGFQEPGILYELWKDRRYNAGYEVIRDKYVADGASHRIDWPASVKDRFTETDVGMRDQASTLDELWNNAVEKLDPYLDAFQADIKEIQSATVGSPTAQAFNLSQIDQGLVARVNEANVKELDEGEFVDGWLKGTLLLLGEKTRHGEDPRGFPDSYLQYVKDGGLNVRIWMWKKGGAFGAGELRYDCLGPTLEMSADKLKGIYDAVAQFSQKKLKQLHS